MITLKTGQACGDHGCFRSRTTEKWPVTGDDDDNILLLLLLLPPIIIIIIIIMFFGIIMIKNCSGSDPYSLKTN
jgi:hypothetical protein